MGYSVHTKGWFCLEYGQEIKAANAIQAAICAETHRPAPTPLPEVYPWDAVVPSLTKNCLHYGVLVSDHMFLYLSPSLTPWAEIVLKAMAPYCTNGSCISFVGESGEKWRWIVENGVLIKEVYDHKDRDFRPGSVMIWG